MEDSYEQEKRDTRNCKILRVFLFVGLVILIAGAILLGVGLNVVSVANREDLILAGAILTAVGGASTVTGGVGISAILGFCSK